MEAFRKYPPCALPLKLASRNQRFRSADDLLKSSPSQSMTRMARVMWEAVPLFGATRPSAFRPRGEAGMGRTAARRNTPPISIRGLPRHIQGRGCRRAHRLRLSCADQIRVAHLDWTCPVAAGLPFEGKGSVSSRPEPANADDVPVREGIVWEGSDAQNPNAKAGRPERGGWCRKHFQLISALFPSSRDSIFALALSCRSLCR